MAWAAMRSPIGASGRVAKVEAFATLVKPTAIGACLAATLAVIVGAKRPSGPRVGHGAVCLSPIIAFLVFGLVLSFSLAFLLSLALVGLGLVLTSPLAFLSAMTFSSLCRGITHRCGATFR